MAASSRLLLIRESPFHRPLELIFSQRYMEEAGRGARQSVDEE